MKFYKLLLVLVLSGCTVYKPEIRNFYFNAVPKKEDIKKVKTLADTPESSLPKKDKDISVRFDPLNKKL